jgi:hypothetical protein
LIEIQTKNLNNKKVNNFMNHTNHAQSIDDFPLGNPSPGQNHHFYSSNRALQPWDSMAMPLGEINHRYGRGHFESPGLVALNQPLEHLAIAATLAFFTTRRLLAPSPSSIAWAPKPAL